MEIVAINCQGIGYRNSISEVGLYLTLPKLGYWTTGRWGSEPGELFETGLMSYERN